MALLRKMALTILVAAGGVGCSHGVRRGTGLVELNEGQTGQSVTVRPGQQVRVTLRETGSTGFQWTAGAECGLFLHLDEMRAVPPADATPGAAGERVWVYTAAEAGGCVLRFVLARSWEKAGSGRTISFPITVSKSE